MKLIQRIITILLAVSIVAGLCVVEHVPKQAQAAGNDIYFTTEDFQKAYAEVLLGLVGWGYRGGEGYDVVGNGTPLNPARTVDEVFDCSGFVVTGLMMMGYDYFIDEAGTKWNLNKQVGMDVFQGTTGIFYRHKTGDKITLHNKTDERFNVTFEFGEVVDMTTVTDIPMGTIICSLPIKKPGGDYDSSNNNGVTYGAFGEHYIGASYKTHIGHVSVALFSMDKADDITPQNFQQKSDAERAKALTDSWNKAAEKIESLFGEAYKTKVTGGSVRNSAYTISEHHWAPFLWDARGRGYGYYMGYDAGPGNYKTGFKDPRCSMHFHTQYSNIWQIECLNETVGVCVNNNPYGKTVTITQSVLLKPVNAYGDIVINKSDSQTQKALSGATFTLYEWSVKAGQYVESTKYRIGEAGSSGKYYVYEGTERSRVLITSDNRGQIRIVETSPPSGYSNIDTSTGLPYAWEYTFPREGGTEAFTIDAQNTPEKGSLEITKKTDKPVEVKEVYWFYITGPGLTAWKSVTIQPGETAKSITLPNLNAGEYTVLEVEKDGDTRSVSETRAVPYSAVGEGSVTVTAGITTNKTITNMITKVKIKKRAK